VVHRRGCDGAAPPLLWQSRRVSWEEELFAVLEDLEQQAAGLYDAERGTEVADRARAEYAAVGLAGRLAASLGLRLVVGVRGAGRLEGVLERVGTGWLLLAGDHQEWLVRLPAVITVAGASARSVPEEAWSPVARLGPATVLRRIADAGHRCVVHDVEGSAYDVVLRRVGRDFVEAVTGDERRSVLLALENVAAVQRRR
jgi:hypothetical protein